MQWLHLLRGVCFFFLSHPTMICDSLKPKLIPTPGAKVTLTNQKYEPILTIAILPQNSYKILMKPKEMKQSITDLPLSGLQNNP